MDEIKTGWWKVSFDLTLEDEEVRFEDLSDVTQEHILHCISQGYSQGEIVEHVEKEEEDDPCENCASDCDESVCDICAEKTN